jgi:hypothetical protein
VAFDPPPCSDKDTETAGEGVASRQKEAHRTALSQSFDKFAQFVEGFVMEGVNIDHFKECNGIPCMCIEPSQPYQQPTAFPPVTKFIGPPQMKGPMPRHTPIGCKGRNRLDQTRRMIPYTSQKRHMHAHKAMLSQTNDSVKAKLYIAYCMYVM